MVFPLHFPLSLSLSLSISIYIGFVCFFFLSCGFLDYRRLALLVKTDNQIDIANDATSFVSAEPKKHMAA